MRSLLAGAAGLALLALHNPANATLAITASDNGTPITLTANSGAPGTLNASGSDANFNVNVSATGSPAVPDPALGSTTLDIHHLGTGTDTLLITVDQTGLSGVTGFASQTEATVNGLIGSPGPSVLTQLVNGTPLETFNFPASSAAQTDSGVDLIPGSILDDAQTYQVTFTGPSAALDTLSFVAVSTAVSEPSTLALVGAALLGMATLVMQVRRT